MRRFSDLQELIMYIFSASHSCSTQSNGDSTSDSDTHTHTHTHTHTPNRRYLSSLPWCLTVLFLAREPLCYRTHILCSEFISSSALGVQYTRVVHVLYVFCVCVRMCAWIQYTVCALLRVSLLSWWLLSKSLTPENRSLTSLTSDYTSTNTGNRKRYCCYFENWSWAVELCMDERNISERLRHSEGRLIHTVVLFIRRWREVVLKCQLCSELPISVRLHLLRDTGI